MILVVLRLFPQFRALEAERDRATLPLAATEQRLRECEAERDELRAALHEETTQKLILQDRLDNVLNDRAALWEMTREAINEERNTLKMMANYRVQTTYGVTPYPEASHLPPSLEPDLDADPVVHRRQLPSEMVSAAKRRLVGEMTARLKKQPA